MAWKLNPFSGKLDYYESGGGSFVHVSGDTMTGDLYMGFNQIKEFEIDNIGTLPAAGNTGRVVYLSSDTHLYLDTG